MIENLGEWRRSHDCGALRGSDAGSEATLMGWVDSIRDHGGLVFVDLRDRTGRMQVVFKPEEAPEAHRRTGEIRSEFVIAVQGTIARRSVETVNPALPTGEVELVVRELRVLNTTEPVPFALDDTRPVSENTRLRYRYLDLRSPRMIANLTLRHRLAGTTRSYFDRLGFLEIETPFLTRSTPEGARDYLVPSRVNPGQFFALPQSPQLFKQILMVSGYDRYFQIVRCFRDEDLRADRQPEFTQIDVEMSFVTPEIVREVIEGLLVEVFRETIGLDLPVPFPRLAYADAMNRYGSDKPDTRFGLEIVDLGEAFADSKFQVFRKVLDGGGTIRGLRTRGDKLSRKDLDDLIPLAASFGAKGLVWIRIQPDGWQSPVAKFLSDEEKARATAVAGLETGDLLLLVADQPVPALKVLGQLRLHLADKLDIERPGWGILWITDFPLLEWDPVEKRHVALHHPFTSPREEDIERLESDPTGVRAQAYDLVINGYEIGGGSIRIHRADVQSRVFAALGIRETEAREKFGFLLDALAHGAPPHGGIALGLDRLAMLLCGEESIREVLPFPKTQKATCLMTQAPSEVDPRQLRELGIRLRGRDT